MNKHLRSLGRLTASTLVFIAFFMPAWYALAWIAENPWSYATMGEVAIFGVAALFAEWGVSKFVNWTGYNLPGVDNND